MACNHSSLLFLYAIFLSFAIGTADTIPAGSCSSADVQAAINLAADNDIVLVPEGTATWATAVTINAKAITLIGAGTGKTVITAANDISPVLSIAGMEGKPFRISGFTFVLGTLRLINVKGTCKNWRIDHCEFNADRGLVAVNVGSLEETGNYTCGVVDNCLFRNCKVLVINGQGHGSWKRPLGLGTAKAIYVEDCQFIDTVFNNVIDANHGGRYVFRYNEVLNSFCEAHSLQNASGPTEWARATRSYEIYHNTFTATDEGPGVFMPCGVRGGTGVIFSNRVENISGDPYNGVGCVDNVRSFSSPNEWLGECDGSNPLDGNEDSTGYPCLDQIGRSTDHGPGDDRLPQVHEPLYAWDNTMDGQLGVFIVHNDCGHHIKEGRDIINNTPKPGYTPYTYPHPLTEGITQISYDGSGKSAENVTFSIVSYGKVFCGEVKGLTQIEIFNLAGRRIAIIPITSRNIVYNCRNNLSNGCYILRLHAVTGTITRRFIFSY